MRSIRRMAILSRRRRFAIPSATGLSIFAAAALFCADCLAQTPVSNPPSVTIFNGNPFSFEGPLAYEYVAVAAMLDEVNLIGPRLNLPVRFPLHREDLKRSAFAPPDLNWSSGNISVENWAFAFSHAGRLCFIENIGVFRAWNKLGVGKRNEMLLKHPSLINLNDALTMATNYLERMHVDVMALEKEMPILAVQQHHWSKEPLPLFEITWGIHPKPAPDDPILPRLKIMIDGSKKELVEIRLEDDSISQRPPGLLKNRDELLKISDDEFLKYSDQQRKDLVAKFSLRPGVAPSK